MGQAIDGAGVQITSPMGQGIDGAGVQITSQTLDCPSDAIGRDSRGV
jgi:hypothetical protein